MNLFDEIKNSTEIKAYIKQADEALKAIGYTEHSFLHVKKCVETTEYILKSLGYDDNTIDLAKTAAYLHDIGNVINRTDHAQSGALMAFVLLNKMNVDAVAIGKIITAIGNHDEKTASPIDPISSALILADKTDVRRSRVRADAKDYDIHDRVNYAVTGSNVDLDLKEKTFSLNIKIDTEICPVMDYFEIFLDRMILCKKACKYFELTFKLYINESIIL